MYTTAFLRQGLVGSVCFILILRYVTSSIWAAHNFALLSASFIGIGGDLPWQNCNETHHGINNTCYDYRLAANCTFAPPTLSYCSQFQHSVIATRDTLARRTPFIHYISNTVFKVIPYMSAIVLLSSLAVYLAMFVFAQVYPHLKSENPIRLTIRGEKFIQAIFPEIFGSFKGGWALSAIFFFTEFILAANTLVICLWVVFSMFSDRAETYSLPWNLRSRLITVAPIVAVGLIASLVLVLPGGFGALFVIDDITAFISLILALLQLLTVAYIYGFRRFTVNIRCMMSTLSTFNAYWWIQWVVTGPILILACILTGILNLIINPAPFDRSLLLFSWLLVLAAVTFVPVMFIISCRRNRNRGGLVQSLLKPTAEWCPLVDQDNKKAIRLERAMRVR